MEAQINIIGSYEIALDAKGRFMFPKSMRDQLPEEHRTKFVIARGFNKNLKMYPKAVYDATMADLNKMSKFSTKVEALKLAFSAYADLVEVDAAGRVTINKDLINLGGLKPSITGGDAGSIRIVAVGDTLQLWDAAAFTAHQATAQSFGELADEVTDGNLLNPFNN